MAKLALFTLTLLTATTVLNLPLEAWADTYRAGNFTITLGEDDELGHTYYGCDLKNNCLYLGYGTGWRDQGQRGITWENKGYFYSISWIEGVAGPMYLIVVDPKVDTPRPRSARILGALRVPSAA